MSLRVDRVPPASLLGESAEETSGSVRARVVAARQRALESGRRHARGLSGARTPSGVRPRPAGPSRSRGRRARASPQRARRHAAAACRAHDRGPGGRRTRRARTISRGRVLPGARMSAGRFELRIGEPGYPPCLMASAASAEGALRDRRSGGPDAGTGRRSARARRLRTDWRALGGSPAGRPSTA